MLEWHPFWPFSSDQNILNLCAMHTLRLVPHSSKFGILNFHVFFIVPRFRPCFLVYYDYLSINDCIVSLYCDSDCIVYTMIRISTFFMTRSRLCSIENITRFSSFWNFIFESKKYFIKKQIGNIYQRQKEHLIMTDNLPLTFSLSIGP